MNATRPTYGAVDKPRHRRTRRRFWWGLLLGAGLFALCQAVVLDRSGGDFATALSTLAMLFVVATAAALFAQAAARDVQDRRVAEETAAPEPVVSDRRAGRRVPYWFTAGFSAGALLMIGLTVLEVRPLPTLVPPAQPQPEWLPTDGPADLPLPYDDR